MTTATRDRVTLSLAELKKLSKGRKFHAWMRLGDEGIYVPVSKRALLENLTWTERQRGESFEIPAFVEDRHIWIG